MTTTILLKNEKSAQKFNEIIQKGKLEGLITSEDSIDCTVTVNYQEWANDINTNPNSHQRHLAPTTEEQLQKMFGSTMPDNAVSLDCYYGRTQADAIKVILDGALCLVSDISSISNGRIMIERADLTEAELKKYLPLEHLNDSKFKPTINKNRKPTSERPDGGILQAYTPNGNQVVHFLFGKVDSPKYLLDDLFLDHHDNEPYENKKGERFALLPLMPLDSSGFKKVTNSIYSYLKYVSSISYYRLMEIAYPGLLSYPYSMDFVTNESKDLLNDADAIELLYDGISKFQSLNSGVNKREIKVKKCKRNGKVEISLPSYINGSSQFQEAIELALSCIKHRKIAFARKIKTNSDLEVITS
ncbi:hypothetical protein [Vibrio owensii]|uniref:hypothetical protein n=1 Tax=Vibrio owensii TaxID=696485 RepID=UPI003CC59059